MTATAQAPHDLDAERAVLGALMRGAPMDGLVPADFYRGAHQIIYEAIGSLRATGSPADPIAVVAELRRRGQLTRIRGADYLTDCVAASPAPTSAGHYAGIVREHAERRQWIERASRIRQAAADPGTDLAIVRDLARDTPAVAAGHAPHSALELDDFLSADEDADTYDWVVPGLLERGDRVMLTGAEGHGKMTLLRQIAVQAASGIHPFTLEVIPPARVVLLDLQESTRQLRRALRPLRISAGDRYKGGLVVECHPQGFNVLNPGEAAAVSGLIMDAAPDLLVAGPIYKLADGDPTDETTGKPVARLLDEIRAQAGAAMLLEAHQPYAAGGKSRRPERPYGWSGWSRWPEFGLCLTDTDQLSHWRGARDQRDWPAALRRGGAWPFTAVTRPRDVLWARIACYCRDAGDQLTERDLAQMTGASQASVHRAIQEHQAEWAALARTGGQGALDDQ